MTHAAVTADLTGSKCEGRRRADRRRAARFACGLGTSRHVIAKIKTDEDGHKITAQVRNISATGISILVDRTLEPERILSVELNRPSRGWYGEVPMRVVYALPHPGGEYVVGGAFTRELTGDELHALLGQLTS